MEEAEPAIQPSSVDGGGIGCSSPPHFSFYASRAFALKPDLDSEHFPGVSFIYFTSAASS